MSSINIETTIQENKKENVQKNQINLVRTDSPNINDNETNKILDKEEQINESTNLKVDTFNLKGIDNNDFYHDKDITEDSIVYFSKKLKSYNDNYKFILYLSIILYLIDIFIWFKAKNILHSFSNLFAIIIISISLILYTF